MPVLSNANLGGRRQRSYGRLLSPGGVTQNAPIIILFLSFDSESEIKNCCNNGVSMHYVNWKKRFNFHVVSVEYTLIDLLLCIIDNISRENERQCLCALLDMFIQNEASRLPLDSNLEAGCKSVYLEL